MGSGQEAGASFGRTSDKLILSGVSLHECNVYTLSWSTDTTTVTCVDRRDVLTCMAMALYTGCVLQSTSVQ